MAIKIETFRCFVAVAQSGKLVDAAEKLGRTPSAVSMMLKQFERHLGAPLFESERKSRLTALGEFALAEANRELIHFERTVAAIERFAHADSGYVRVAAVPSVADAILPEAVRQFRVAHPDVYVDIRDMDSAAVLEELARDEVDLGLATATGTGPEFERDALFSDAFGIVCRADHPLAGAHEPADWHNLEPYPFIANGVCAHIAHASFQNIFASSQLMVRNTTSLLAMVRAGIGVTVLPRLAVNDNADDIEFVAVNDRAARRQIDLLRRAHAPYSPAAQNFAHVIRTVAGQVSLSGSANGIPA